MKINNKNLAETFSASSNDSDPSIGEIRKKIKHKKSNNDVTTYKVVAHIMANKKIKLLEYEHMDVEQFYVPKKGTICKNKTIG